MSDPLGFVTVTLISTDKDTHNLIPNVTYTITATGYSSVVIGNSLGFASILLPYSILDYNVEASQPNYKKGSFKFTIAGNDSFQFVLTKKVIPCLLLVTVRDKDTYERLASALVTITLPVDASFSDTTSFNSNGSYRPATLIAPKNNSGLTISVSKSGYYGLSVLAATNSDNIQFQSVSLQKKP